MSEQQQATRIGVYNGPGKIKTYTGRWFDLLNPKPEDVDIIDIATALSREVRWGNHSRKPITVAEHSIIVANNFQLDKKAALLHDAAETYLMDFPRPIKELFPEYKIMEAKIMRAIAQRFGFEYPFKQGLEEADNNVLHMEYCYLMFKPGEKEFVDYSATFSCWPFNEAYIKFLESFVTIFNLSIE